MIIGGSYIGTEVAASLTAAHGVKCSVVMLEQVALERQFGSEVGASSIGCSRSTGWSCTPARSSSASRARTVVRRVVTKGGGSSVRLRGDRRRGHPGSHARPRRRARPRRGRRRAARQASRPPPPASSRPATSASTTAPCTTGRCGSSIGTSRSTRARPPHSTCSAGRGARHDAVLLLRPRGLVVDGVRRPGGGETVIRGSLEDGEFAAFYLDDGRVRRRSPSAAPTTSSTRAGSSPSARGRIRAPSRTRTAISARCSGHRTAFAKPGCAPGWRVLRPPLGRSSPQFG